MMNREKHEKHQVILGCLIHYIGVFFDKNDISNQTDAFCKKLAKHNKALSTINLWQQLATEKVNKSHLHLQTLLQFAHQFAISEQQDKKPFSTDKEHFCLQPLLERVNLPETNLTTKTLLVDPRPIKHHLPLKALSLHEIDIYPTSDSEAVQNDHKKLLAEFWQAFETMPSFSELTDNTLPHLAYNLLSLFERFFSQVPAQTLNTDASPADISLFDHLRIKAAIAEGLYEYHQHDFANADFADEEKPKWRLVCGDFSGIQKFIYNIVSKNAAKALRGRSLYIQLLCDAVSQHLTHKLNLFPTTQIYSSGGKFYLLIPENKESDLKAVVTEINRWLLMQFRGIIFLGIGVAKVSAKYFRGGEMGVKWKEANENLMQDRQQRFKAVMDIADDFFNPMPLYEKNNVEKNFCEVCGRDDSDAKLNPSVDKEKNTSRVICEQCIQLEKLGKKLSQPMDFPHYFLWVWDDKIKINLPDEFKLFSCSFYLIKEENLEHIKKVKIHPNHRCFLEKINKVDCFNTPQLNTRFRLIGLWDITKESWDYEFDEFAEHSKGKNDATGIKRLGILRMDVDNLGQVFINGLNFESDKQKMGSLSRVATLSRQLNLFFSGHLNELLKHDYQRTQIIYAGGDDLFLIGSWDELPDVANEIRQKFSQYCAYNPNFTLSGGMAMVSGRYPISRAASLAGAQEEMAKSLKYQNKQKNAFCFLDTPIPWSMYDDTKQFNTLLFKIIEESDSRAIIDRLRNAVLGMQKYKELAEKPQKDMEELKQLVMYQKWRWQLIYNISRMTKRYAHLKAELDDLVKIIMYEDKLPLHVVDWLPLPVRWVEFLTRKGRDND